MQRLGCAGVALAFVFCAASEQPSSSTLYVSPAFEVRDHDQPVKYVLDGDTRVAHVTGSLSNRPRLQRLRLWPGWNLCSLAVTATNAMAQLNASGAQGPGGLVLAAYQWNPVNMEYDSVTPAQTVAAGSVLWIHASTYATVAVTGDYVAPTNRTVEGAGRFQPAAGLEAWDIRSILEAHAGTTASDFDGASQTWNRHLGADLGSDPNFPGWLAPGEALLVDAITPAAWAAPDPGLRIRYFHPDLLGSSSVITDADGALVEETAFHPFGHPRNEFRPRQAHEPYQFVQKERDDESGLQNFGRRFYHPTLGRWLSTDPEGERGGSMNLYGYAHQNPLKFTDPDGGEITITPTFRGKGRHQKIVHYQIQVKAVLINLSPILKGAGYDKAKVQQFADTLKATIEKSYSNAGSGKKGEVTWETKVDIQVIDDVSQIQQGQHVFRLVDATYDRSRGLSQHGGFWMEIQADTFLKRRPAVEGSDKLYLSPESTGAHELGHTGGLDHWSESSPNLMQKGSQREYDARMITQKQIETMYQEYKAGRLNQGSSKIGSWEHAHQRHD